MHLSKLLSANFPEFQTDETIFLEKFRKKKESKTQHVTQFNIVACLLCKLLAMSYEQAHIALQFLQVVVQALIQHYPSNSIKFI